jgi:hypothetical protein
VGGLPHSDQTLCRIISLATKGSETIAIANHYGPRARPPMQPTLGGGILVTAEIADIRIENNIIAGSSVTGAQYEREPERTSRREGIL